MQSGFYTNRAYVLFNGSPMTSNITSLTVTDNQNVTPQHVMTLDRSVGGWIAGNFELSLQIEEAIPENGQGYIADWSSFDYDADTYTIIALAASSAYPVNGLIPYDGPSIEYIKVVYTGSTVSFPGAGQAATRTSNFYGLTRVVV